MAVESFKAQLLTLLEGAVKRDYISPNYETTSELLSASVPGSNVNNASVLSGSTNVLPWIPQTTAAVVLRLMDFDASIAYTHQKAESYREKEDGGFMKISRYAVVKNTQETESMEMQDAFNYQEEGNWAEFGFGHSLPHGRGYRARGGGRGRGRGGRGQRGNIGLTRANVKEGKAKNTERPTRKQRKRGRTRGRGRSRGRRTVRSRQRSENRVPIGRGTRLRGLGGIRSSIIRQQVVEDSPRESPVSSAGEEWSGMETGTGRVYAEEDDSSAGVFESDENGQPSADEFDDQGTEHQEHYVNKAENLTDDSEEDADEDEEGDGDDGEEEMELDGEEIEYEDEDGGDGEENEDEDAEGGVGEGNDEEDEDATSYSSEYSD